MRRLRYTKPVSQDLKTALWASLLLLIGLLASGCISLPDAGPKRYWNPPTYIYEPTVAGKCILKDHVNGHAIDCDEPKMYEMSCVQTLELKVLEADVIRQCKVWR